FASLIGNAVEALVSKPRDEARIEVRLLLHKDHASEIAELHVSDNGSGMDPAVRARAMDPFFSTRGADRTGLGLVLARSRVQRAEWIHEDAPPGAGSVHRRARCSSALSCARRVCRAAERCAGPEASADDLAGFRLRSGARLRVVRVDPTTSDRLPPSEGDALA